LKILKRYYLEMIQLFYKSKKTVVINSKKYNN